MKDEDRYLEIGPSGKRKRTRGLVAFILFFAGVGWGLAYLLMQFTRNWILAVVLVGFMVGYMSIMGWLAMRKQNDNENGMMK